MPIYDVTLEIKFRLDAPDLTKAEEVVDDLRSEIELDLGERGHVNTICRADVEEQDARAQAIEAVIIKLQCLAAELRADASRKDPYVTDNERMHLLASLAEAIRSIPSKDDEEGWHPSGA